MSFPGRCSECHEWIPIGVPVDPQGTLLCADCSGETRELMRKQYRPRPIEATDKAYHGDMFYSGEW